MADITSARSGYQAHSLPRRRQSDQRRGIARGQFQRAGVARPRGARHARRWLCHSHRAAPRE